MVCDGGGEKYLIRLGYVWVSFYSFSAFDGDNGDKKKTAGREILLDDKAE